MAVAASAAHWVSTRGCSTRRCLRARRPPPTRARRSSRAHSKPRTLSAAPSAELSRTRVQVKEAQARRHRDRDLEERLLANDGRFLTSVDDQAAAVAAGLCRRPSSSSRSYRPPSAARATSLAPRPARCLASDQVKVLEAERDTSGSAGLDGPAESRGARRRPGRYAAQCACAAWAVAPAPAVAPARRRFPRVRARPPPRPSRRQRRRRRALPPPPPRHAVAARCGRPTPPCRRSRGPRRPAAPAAAAAPHPVGPRRPWRLVAARRRRLRRPPDRGAAACLPHAARTSRAAGSRCPSAAAVARAARAAAPRSSSISDVHLGGRDLRNLGVGSVTSIALWSLAADGRGGDDEGGGSKWDVV